MFLITKKFKFDAAHNLINYKGACENLHGHTYDLEVTFTGEKKKDGMVIDFNEIKKVVKTEIINKLDHAYINDIIDQPTAENISEWIWQKIYGKCKSAELYKIKLWEGPNSFVTYKK